MCRERRRGFGLEAHALWQATSGSRQGGLRGGGRPLRVESWGMSHEQSIGDVRFTRTQEVAAYRTAAEAVARSRQADETQWWTRIIHEAKRPRVASVEWADSYVWFNTEGAEGLCLVPVGGRVRVEPARPAADGGRTSSESSRCRVLNIAWPRDRREVWRRGDMIEACVGRSIRRVFSDGFRVYVYWSDHGRCLVFMSVVVVDRPRDERLYWYESD